MAECVLNELLDKLIEADSELGEEIALQIDPDKIYKVGNYDEVLRILRDTIVDNIVDFNYKGKSEYLMRPAKGTTEEWKLTNSFGNPFMLRGQENAVDKITTATNGVASVLYYNWLTEGIVPEGYKGDKNLLEKRREWVLKNLHRIRNAKALKYVGTGVNDDVNHVKVLVNLASNGIKSEGKSTTNIFYGTGENAELSNLAVRPFTLKGKQFQSVEHAYQSLKSGGLEHKVYDKDWSKGGLVARGTKGTKGNKEGPDKDWNINVLMKKLLAESFKQNQEAWDALLATKGQTLTHTQGDKVWQEAFPRLLMEIRDGKTAPRSKEANVEAKPDLKEPVKVEIMEQSLKDSNKFAETLFTENKEFSKVGTPKEYTEYLKTIFPNSLVQGIKRHVSSVDFFEEGFKNTPGGTSYAIYFTDLNDPSYGDLGSHTYYVKLNIQNDFDKYRDGENYASKRFGKELVDRATAEWAKKGYISDNSFKGDHVLEYMLDTDPEPDLSGYGMSVPKESLEAYQKAGYDGFIVTKNSWAEYDTIFSGEQAHILGASKDIEMFKKWKEQTKPKVSNTKDDGLKQDTGTIHLKDRAASEKADIERLEEC